MWLEGGRSKLSAKSARPIYWPPAMRPRLWSALLSVGLCGAVISVFLTSSSARLPIKTPFVAKTERGRPLLTPLVRAAGGAGAPLYRLDLVLASSTTLLEHPEIQLFFSTCAGNTR